MDHFDFVHLLVGTGAEVGAHTKPIPGISPIYIDKYPEFAGEPCLMDRQGTLYELPFSTDSLDYLAHSHVLEHCANPVLALAETHRVLRPGGIAYIVVPDKTKTWDRNRPTTPVEHMIEDYRNEVSDRDGTHIDDFVFGIVWEEVHPATPPEEVGAVRKAHADQYRRDVAAGKEINIHFHTFDTSNLAKLVEVVNRQVLPNGYKVLHLVPNFPASHPNGVLLVLRKRRGRFSLSAKIAAWKNRQFPTRQKSHPQAEALQIQS